MSELAVIDSNNYAAMAQMTGMAYDAEGGKQKHLGTYQAAEKTNQG